MEGSSAGVARTLASLPLEAWEGTKRTLHRYAQVVGKIRLGYSAPMNHWWNVTLYIAPRGLTTGPIPYGDGTFEVQLDFVAHELRAISSAGGSHAFALEDGLTVGEFYARVFGGLGALGLDVEIDPTPFDIGGEPLDRDSEHGSYDAEYVGRYWRILVWVDSVFKEFAGRFNGKQSPVHLFWHSFDLALTRFSGRRAPVREGADPVTRQAYSHEVISFGFWAGDDAVREPSFYSYAAPEPDGLTARPLRPPEALWAEEGGTALLPYEVVRGKSSPKETLLEFMESAYLAGAETAGWDIEGLRNSPMA